jgi:phosphatidate cytidylyltransferase
MLGYRIATALVLAPLALAAIFWLPTAWFAVVFCAVAALGAYEWAGMSGLHNLTQRLFYVAVFIALAFMLYGQTQLYQPILMAGCAFWLLATVAVLIFPRAERIYGNGWFMALVGIALLIPAWLSLVVIHALEQGSFWLVWMFVLVWGADVGAYFAGRAYGKHKLAPAVSPGKTWQGAFGGFVLAAVLCGSALPFLQDQGQGQWLPWLPFMAALIVISVFGDLFESVVKRASGVKDSGSLLPGHGGVLDRIDSLLAVLPVFAVMLQYA